MASRPKTRARLQGALASRKDKRTSYPLPATHQEAPRNRFWGLFLAFRYKRASSSVNALRTALRPSRSHLALQLLAGLLHLLRLGGQRAKLLADALHLALDDFVGGSRVLLVFNKIDNVGSESAQEERAVALRAQYPGCLVMSARRPDEVATLHAAIVATFSHQLVDAELFLPWSAQQLRGQIYANCTVLEERADGDGAFFRVRGESAAIARLREQLERE